MIKYDKNQLHYIVVTGIILYEDKYLVVKRADWEKAFPGKWTVPGGKLEVLDYALKKKDTSEHWYNTFENLLKREVREETGLEINDIGYVTSMVYIRPDNIPCIIVSLYAKSNNGNVKLCTALSDYSWVTLDESKEYDLIEGIYHEIEILDNFLKTGKHMIWEGNS